MTKQMLGDANFIGAYYLVFDEDEYETLMKRLPSRHHDSYYEGFKSARAWVKSFVNPKDGHDIYIVCLHKQVMELSVPVIVGLLAHEATHIVQLSMKSLGERNPSMEFEAYLIGNVTRDLCRVFFDHNFPQLLRPRRVKSRG